ncbi:MAG: AAA family ATPase [Patescibacteria group bacterium]
MTSATKRLIVLCGLPFSGKTSYTKTLSQPFLLIARDAYLHDINQDPVLLQRLRQEASELKAQLKSTLFATQEENAFNDLVTKEYVHRVENVIFSSSDDVVVVDGTHLQRLSRSFIRAFPDREKVAVVIDTPLEECVRRFRNTNSADQFSGLRSSLTEQKLRDLARIFERPTEDEGFDQILTISPS